MHFNFAAGILYLRECSISTPHRVRRLVKNQNVCRQPISAKTWSIKEDPKIEVVSKDYFIQKKAFPIRKLNSKIALIAKKITKKYSKHRKLHCEGKTKGKHTRSPNEVSIK